MSVNLVIVTVDVICVLAAFALTLFTARFCRASRVPYLLGIPAGFGLLTLSFAAEALTALALPTAPILGESLLFAFLLTQTYGFLFLAFTYARRTRLRVIGESNAGVIVSGLGVTVLLLGTILTDGLPVSQDSMPLGAELLARVVVILAILYVVYETARSWSFSHKAVEGFVSIAFIFLLVEQIGFALSSANFGDAATFLGYEGRVLGLFILTAILYVGVKPGDFITPLKRLGLEAPAH